MRRDVFQAIADPTRRKIIDTLVQRPLTPNSVASNFHISRPAVSKHIKILTECGLVIVKKTGRERYCEINFNSLREVSDWVDKYRVFWTKRLDALGEFLQEENNPSDQQQTVKRKTKNSNNKK
jgi:DNA-binding transcriptional ArsR family regulator